MTLLATFGNPRLITLLVGLLCSCASCCSRLGSASSMMVSLARLVAQTPSVVARDRPASSFPRQIIRHRYPRRCQSPSRRFGKAAHNQQNRFLFVFHLRRRTGPRLARSSRRISAARCEYCAGISRAVAARPLSARSTGFGIHFLQQTLNAAIVDIHQFSNRNISSMIFCASSPSNSRRR